MQTLNLMRAHFEKHHKEKALEWFEQQAGMDGEGDMEEMMQVRSFRRGALDSIRLQHAGFKDLPVYRGELVVSHMRAELTRQLTRPNALAGNDDDGRYDGAV